MVLRDNLNVALVSAEFPPSLIGGIGAVCNDLAFNLSKNGVRTTVFCGRSNNVTVERLNDYLTVVRMPILNLPPRHLWFQTQNLSSLSVLLKDFDVVHNLDPRSGLLAYFTKRLHKPLITHVHECGHCMTRVFLKSPVSYWSPGDFVFSMVEYPMNEYLARMSLRNSNHFIVCSNTRLNELKQRNPNFNFTQASVIYNGINFDKIDATNSAVKDDACSVLFWGRLYYVKGIIQLVRAIKLVKCNYPEVSLDVCGKGPLEAKVKSLVTKLGLEANVHLHGYVNKKNLIEKINKASVVVLPSLHEGQPMTALEAMAYGKPVIMYDYPFAREFITDWHDGLIARGNDIDDLACRIRTALSDRKLRLKLGQNAYSRVRRAHDWTVLVHKYIDTYHEAVNISSTATECT